jgi:hypothetical protein
MSKNQNEVVENKVEENVESGLVLTKDDNENVSLELLDTLRNPDGNLKMFCSLKGETRQEKGKIYNAVNSQGEKLLDNVGTILEIVDVVLHVVELEDEQTHKIEPCIRTVVIDKDGKIYTAVSGGVAKSIQNIFAFVGSAPWREEPVKVVPVEVKTKKGFRMLQLQMVID